MIVPRRISAVISTTPPSGLRSFLIRGSWLLLITAPFIFLFILIRHYGVNVPYGDQWELVPFFKEFHEGDLSFADFWNQHNEHRILFPRMLMLVLAVVSDWNIRYELYLNLLLGLGIFVITLMLLKKSLVYVSRWSFVAGSILLSLIVFSPTQWENWLWGWQIQWFLAVFGVVLAVWALSGWPWVPWQGFIVAVLGGVVATYSLASGFFVWICCIPLFLVRTTISRLLPLWIGIGGLITYLYYMRYHKPIHHPPLTSFMDHPIAFVEYVFTFLSSSLFAGRGTLLVGPLLAIAFVVSILYLFVRHRTIFFAALPWVSLAGYALLSGAAIAVTRVGFGVHQAMASRYTTVSQLFVIAVMVLALLAIENLSRGRNKRILWIASSSVLILFLSAGLLASYVASFRHMYARQDLMLRTKHCLVTATDPADPCLAETYPSTAVAYERAQYLEEIGWGGLTPSD